MTVPRHYRPPKNPKTVQHTHTPHSPTWLPKTWKPFNTSFTFLYSWCFLHYWLFQKLEHRQKHPSMSDLTEKTKNKKRVIHQPMFALLSFSFQKKSIMQTLGMYYTFFKFFVKSEHAENEGCITVFKFLGKSIMPHQNQ